MRFLSQHLCQHGLFLLCVKVSSSVPSSGVDWRLKTVAGCSLLTLRSPSPVFLLRSGDHTWKTPVSVTSRPNITTEIRQIMSVLMTLPACRCCFLVCWWWKMKKKTFPSRYTAQFNISHRYYHNLLNAHGNDQTKSSDELNKNIFICWAKIETSESNWQSSACTNRS